ncbi:RNA helicase [Chlorella sorokiniana]|uniref:RNA helicase n=1 Tax=Chlorella sorokiniana TaxID=3076 RepID=A0A2P6TE40_CHLSO|nr:RNA helicase [Chlorella sorokiniana]|eukprot:PRW20899.1 RNA helicase [Chlorella sorokiniana]
MSTLPILMTHSGNCSITGKPSDANSMQRYTSMRCATCSEDQAVYFLRIDPQDAGCCASSAFLATWPLVARRDGLSAGLKAWGCTFDPSWAAFNSLLCGASNDTFTQLVAAASGASTACPAGVAAALNKNLLPLLTGSNISGPAVKDRDELKFTGIKLKEAVSTGYSQYWAVVYGPEGGLWKYPVSDIAFCSAPGQAFTSVTVDFLQNGQRLQQAFKTTHRAALLVSTCQNTSAADASCSFCTDIPPGPRVWVGDDKGFFYGAPCNDSRGSTPLGACHEWQATGRRKASTCNDGRCYAERLVPLAAGSNATGPLVGPRSLLDYTGIKLKDAVNARKFWGVVYDSNGALWKLPTDLLRYCDLGISPTQCTAKPGSQFRGEDTVSCEKDEECCAGMVCSDRACAPKAGSSYRNELGSSCTSHTECCDGLQCIARATTSGPSGKPGSTPAKPGSTTGAAGGTAGPKPSVKKTIKPQGSGGTTVTTTVVVGPTGTKCGTASKPCSGPSKPSNNKPTNNKPPSNAPSGNKPTNKKPNWPKPSGCKHCNHGKAGRKVWLGKDGEWIYRKPCNKPSNRLRKLSRCDVVELTGKRHSSSCNDKHCYAEVVVKRGHHGAVIKTGWVEEHKCGTQGSPFGPKNHPSCWCGPQTNNNNSPNKPTFKDMRLCRQVVKHPGAKYLVDLKTGGNGPRVWSGNYLNYQGVKLNKGGEYWLVVMGQDGNLYRYPERDTQYCKQGMGYPEECKPKPGSGRCEEGASCDNDTQCCEGLKCVDRGSKTTVMQDKYGVQASFSTTDPTFKLLDKQCAKEGVTPTDKNDLSKTNCRQVKPGGDKLVDKAGSRYSVLRDSQTKGFWTYPAKDLGFCGTPEAESACYMAVEDTLSNPDVCPPQADGSLALSPNNTCCQALADADSCWDSFATQDEPSVWTVGGKNYTMEDYLFGCNSTSDTGGEVACLTFDTYTWLAGKASSAENLGARQPEASPEELAAACDANEQCAGFTTDGWLKAAGGELVEFEGSGACDGYYQAQLDPSAKGQDCTDPPEGYPFFQHQDSPGDDLEGKLEGTPQQMADKCSETPGCAGFTSDGRMKSAIKEPLEAWANPTGDCDGIYAANARTGTDTASNCTTVEGFAFNAGQDSLGGDLASTTGKSVAALARLCASTPGCRAFTTAGSLKSSVSDPLEDWEDAGPCDGIYTSNAPAEPECSPPEVANYTFEAGKDSAGEELQLVTEFGSPADLAVACATLEGCAAFTTDGRLKAASDGSLVDWQGEGNCSGVYIRDEVPTAESVEANLAGVDEEQPCKVPNLANFSFYQGQDVAAEVMESMAVASAQEAADACLARLGCTGFSLVDGTASLKSGAGERYPMEQATPCDGYWLLTATEPPEGTEVPVETRIEDECPPEPPGYVFYPGKNSNGGDLEQRSGTLEELAAQCNENVQGCLGFTANGWLKSAVKSAEELDAWPDATPCAGLYMRNLGSNPLRESPPPESPPPESPSEPESPPPSPESPPPESPPPEQCDCSGADKGDYLAIASDLKWYASSCDTSASSTDVSKCAALEVTGTTQKCSGTCWVEVKIDGVAQWLEGAACGSVASWASDKLGSMDDAACAPVLVM